MPEYLNEEEVRAILETPYKTKIRDRSLMLLAAKCGLRAMEILNLRPMDIEYMESTNRYKIIVRDGKGGKDRVIPCPHDVAKLVEIVVERADKDPDEKIFDLSYQGLYKLFKRYGEAAEIPKKVTPHVFRHSYAVHRIRAGMDVRTLQKILGHASIKTTSIYLQLTQEDVLDAADRYPLPY